jgi:uncharacterized protein
LSLNRILTARDNSSSRAERLVGAVLSVRGAEACVGREYGIFLGVASQRPAELDPTIISQCSTLFVMRMVNDRDQEIIGSAVSDAAANLVSLLPSLGTREVLAFGEGVALPTRIAFTQLPEHLVPSSKVSCGTRSVSAQSGQQEYVESVVARWCGASAPPGQSVPQDAPQALPRLPNNLSIQPSSTPAADRFSILKRNVPSGHAPAVKPQNESRGRSYATADVQSRQRFMMTSSACR